MRHDIRTAALIGEAMETMAGALAARRKDLATARTDGDTEQLRVTVQRYREFLDRLLPRSYPPAHRSWWLMAATATTNHQDL